jgi:hypothetical protein
MCLRSRDSTKAGIKGAGMQRRYIFPLSMATVHSKVNAGTAVKYVGTRPKGARSQKGIFMEDEPARTKESIPAMVGST